MKTLLSHFSNLSPEQIRQFEALLPLYREWNARINVISRKDLEHFYVRHVLHSLAIAKVVSFVSETSILDVGTGGGFPAIPLAILFPETKFLAVDSIGKKIKVVGQIAESIQLNNLRAEHKRAEEVDEKFDFIVSRAVTRTNRFMPWVEHKFKTKSFNTIPNGFLFLKGGDLEDELAEVKKEYQQFSINEMFGDEFFQTKSVIYFPK